MLSREIFEPECGKFKFWRVSVPDCGFASRRVARTSSDSRQIAGRAALCASRALCASTFLAVAGAELPCTSSRPPTLQEIVDHLTALTTDSLPLALAHITLNGDGGQGLGLLSASGSRISDIITTLAVFGTRYEEKRWLTFLQIAIPGCTELEAQSRWLLVISHPASTSFDSPLPAPQSRNKRKASSIGGSEIRNTKRSAATSGAPVRRSPRSHQTPIAAPTVTHDMEAPSHLAASHQNLRPQLEITGLGLVDDCMALPSTLAQAY
jgi:hypothetical protein